MAYYYHGDSAVKAGSYLRPIDQNSAPQLVAPRLGLIPNSFTPDGRMLAVGTGFLQALGSNIDIGIVTLGDTTVRWIVNTEFSERQPQISRDGKRFAYTSNRTGRPEIYVQAMSGDAVPVPVSTNGGTAARWARDGRLFYIDQNGQVTRGTAMIQNWRALARQMGAKQ